MKILQLTQHYLPVCGGVETVVHELSRRLVSAGHEVTVICEREPKTSQYEIIDGVKIQRVKGIRLLKLKYDVGRIAPKMLLSSVATSADLINCHNYGHFPLFVSCFVNKPTIITTHSDPTTKIYGCWDMFRSIPLRLCDRIVAVTNLEKQNLIRRGAPKDRISVIPNGVTLPPLTVPKMDLDSTIFCLGRLDMWTKGQDILIKAMPNILSEVKNAQLFIAGTGKDLPLLRAMAKRLNVENNVHFLGQVDSFTKASYLQNSSVFCLPSRVEAFGIVYLEAMAYGLPIVATKIGGVPEVLSDVGLIVKKDDPTSLSNALIAVLSDKKLAKEMRRKSLARVKHFDWNRLVKKYELLYESVLHS